MSTYTFSTGYVFSFPNVSIARIVICSASAKSGSTGIFALKLYVSPSILYPQLTPILSDFASPIKYSIDSIPFPSVSCPSSFIVWPLYHFLPSISVESEVILASLKTGAPLSTNIFIIEGSETLPTLSYALIVKIHFPSASSLGKRLVSFGIFIVFSSVTLSNVFHIPSLSSLSSSPVWVSPFFVAVISIFSIARESSAAPDKIYSVSFVWTSVFEVIVKVGLLKSILNSLFVSKVFPARS